MIGNQKGFAMKNILQLFVVIIALSLFGCDKPQTSNNSNDESNALQSGDEGIQREKENNMDEKIQINPVMPNDNPEIIIPPPQVNMPPDIVPEKPAN